MEVCDITWCCHVVSRGVTWCHMVSHGVTRCHMVSRGVTWCHVGPGDVTGMKCEPRRLRGLAPKGKKAQVETKKQERCQSRLDIWGAISYNKSLAMDIQNSDDRKKKGVRGYGKTDVKLFLRKKMAPQIAKMKTDVIVCMDRGFHFIPDEIETELRKGGAKNIEDVWIFPPNAGKLCNPLDNTLWHSMKEKVRKRSPEDERTTAL